jgi:glucokinase
VASDGALGLALGDDQLLVTLASPDDLERRVSKAASFESGTPEEFVDAAFGLAQKLLESDEPPRLSSVGAAIPGHVNHADGTIVYGQNLKMEDDECWHGERLVDRLEARFEAPAAIDNDVNSMVVYQQELGIGRGEPAFVVVYLAPEMDGIGSGIVIDRKIVRGCAGGAGELGHVVVQPGGPLCPCRNRGCLQAVVGAETIVRNVNWGHREASVDNLAEAAELAERGDERAVVAFKQAGRSFGQGLAALINLLNPPLTIIGGPEEIVPVPTDRRRGGSAKAARRRSMRSAQAFGKGYMETLTRYSFAKLELECRIEIDRLTLEMAAVGAAILGVRAAARKPLPVL